MAAGIFLAVAAWGVGGISRLQVDGGLDSLLPSGDPTVAAMADMAQQFGEDPIVVLVEGGGNPLGPKRLPALFRLEGQLAQLPDVTATYGPATTLNQTVLQVKHMLADLSGQRDALVQAHRARALRRFDERYGALIVRAMPAGLPTLSNAAFVRTVVLDPRTGEARPSWRQYLPATDTVAIYLRPRAGLSESAADSVVSAVRRTVAESGAVPPTAKVTIAGAPVVSSDVAGRVRGEVPRLALSAFAVAAVVLLLVPWTRRRLARLAPLAIMATATVGTLGGFGWFGGSLSIGAATFLPIILGIGSYYPVYLSRKGRRRVVLAVATSSAFAFAGLLLSPLPFVAELGAAVPAGLALVVALSLVAAWARPDLGGSAEAPEPRLDAPIVGLPPSVAATLIAVMVVVSAVGWVELSSARLKTDPQQLLAGLPSLDDAVHVEDVLGYSGEIDVRLVGPSSLAPEALRWSRVAEQSVVTTMGDQVHPVVTVSGLLSFLGTSPTAEQVRAGVAALPPYVAGAVLSSDGQQGLTSYGVSWSDIAADPHLVANLERTQPPPPSGYRVVVSGLPVAAQRGYQLVSSERYEPSLVALAAAAFALLLLLARRRDGLVAVGAAAIAAGLNIALLDAVVGSLNPLTLPLGALTAAVGAEFTVLLVAARRDGDPGTRRAVMLAALLSMGGYGVLLTSSLPVLRELGLALTASVLLSALVALTIASLVRTGTPSDRRAARVGRSGRSVADAGAEALSVDLLETVGGSR